MARGKELDSEIQACEARLEELRKACGKLQARAAALQAQLDDVGGPQLRQQRAKVAQMQKVTTISITAQVHMILLDVTDLGSVRLRVGAAKAAGGAVPCVCVPRRPNSLGSDGRQEQPC